MLIHNLGVFDKKQFLYVKKVSSYSLNHTCTQIHTQMFCHIWIQAKGVSRNTAHLFPCDVAPAEPSPHYQLPH